ncbi:MAG: hypothetical protein CM15mV76_510 [uncultured marine virus]|nr:MAG: hypothetical protein CM15mV76_510 [uncultured marine virus]
MASVKGTNFTNITADPIVKIDSGEWSGKMRVQYDTYEASSLASGSDISVARLPKGAKVYDIVVMHFDALGSDLTTISVGDSGSCCKIHCCNCNIFSWSNVYVSMKVQSTALATRTLQRQMYY